MQIDGIPLPGVDRILDAPSPRLMKSHVPARYFEKPLKSNKLKTIVVTRDPRDMLVSNYRYCHTLLGDPVDFTFETYFNMYMKGKLFFGDWGDHTREWLEAGEANPENFLFLTFEQLVENHSGVVRKVAEFCGVSLTDAQVDRITHLTHFKQLKNSSYNINMSPKTVSDPSKSQFIRQGRTGTYTEYFTAEMVDAIRKLKDEKLGKYKDMFNF